MQHTNFRKTAMGIAAVVSAMATLPNATLAQCVPGAGATSAQLSAQAWPRRAGADFNVTGAALGSLQSATRIVADGTAVDVLDAAQGKVLQLRLVGSSSLTASAMYPREDTNKPFPAGARLIATGETIWVASANGVVSMEGCLVMQSVVGAWTCSGTVGYASSLALPGIQDGTFDGTSVWFSGNAGLLAQVSPPVAQSTPGQTSPTWTPPQVLKSYRISNAGLGTVLFDGRYLWTYSGNNLIQFDPQAGQSVATFPQASTITSLFFDGTFLWLGTASGSALQFDPVKATVVSQLLTGGTVALFDGATVAGINTSGQVNTFRSCDLAPLNRQMLPGQPVSETMAGGRYWFVYGNGTVSVR